ncbi:hypothetical protein FSP39_000531 [Pinctada imbricata]|uniref:Ion transport domain-containing protein n=1 Tax=Pinctada imbricata TaxID=66713 RepID=A0AA88XKC4_PINIB|nr:hypothetical protein FSP39_000531 [Pinctada imbricata]
MCTTGRERFACCNTSNDDKKVHILYDVLMQETHAGICRKLLDSPAHSRDRKGTVMEGEYALSIAALKLNKQTVDYLLKLGANVYLQNSWGDNVIHSLIGYAAVRPEKVVEIRDMIGFIYRYVADSKVFNVKRLFTMVNDDQRTPLQLAVVKNVSELCTYLMSLKNVYLRGGRQGIYERKIYDITYLDSLTNREANRKKDGSKSWVPTSDSVLEMIFANNTHNDTALAVVKHEIIAYIIKLKWRSYLPLFLIWMFLHYTAMIILTAYSIVRIDVFFRNDSRNVPTELNGEIENDFVVVAYWLILLFGFVFTIPLALFIFSRTIAKPEALKNSFHNTDYFFMYLFFIICIFVDSIFLGGGSKNYNGEALVFSVLFGWLFATIFLRAIEKCGQITFLVRRVIVRDILGFVLVFLFLLVAFAACLHDLLKYKIDENGLYVPIQNFETFGRTMFTMFHAMLGLSNVDEVFDSRSSWLAITLLIVFLIITYGLLLNALIGIITSTSEEIFAHKHGYMSVHRLSVLIFMEEFFLLHRFMEPMGRETEIDREECVILEIKSETSIMTEEDKVISKEKEENLKLRNVVYDALHVSETVVYGYKCVDCKRREMVLAANDKAVDYKIRQTFKLDSDGKPIDIKLKARSTMK